MTMPKLRFKSNELLREVSLSEVGNFYGGLSGKTKSDFGFGDSKFITYMNVFTNTIAKQDMCDLVMVGHNEKQNLVVDGDVLFTQSSETPEEVVMASVWTHKQKVYLNSFSFGLRIKNKQNVDPVYLTYLLRSPVYRKSISIQAQGISRYNLSSSRLSTLKVKIPALEEQQKIAAFFTALDRRIENCEKRLVTLEHLKKGLLQKMLSSNSRTLPEIRFKGFAGSWKAYKLSEVLDEIYVGQTPRRNHKEFWNGAINWLSSRDLTRGFVEETAEKITDVGMKSTRLRIVPYGTVVIAMIGLDAENTRGNCGILKIDSTINQSCAALIPKKDKIIPEFLLHWYKFFGNDLALHYTQGTKQQNYNVDILSILPIHIPSLEEQKKISAFLSTIDEQIVNGEKTKNNLIRLKNGLLQQMFI